MPDVIALFLFISISISLFPLLHAPKVARNIHDFLKLLRELSSEKHSILDLTPIKPFERRIRNLAVMVGLEV